MELSGAIAGVWGALIVLALVTSGVTLWLLLRAGSTFELTRRVHQVELDVADQFDRLEQWMARDKTRRFRAGKETPVEVAPQPGTPEYKSYLRARLRANSGERQ